MIAESTLSELAAKAKDARKRAYAPYSRFLVGAAVLTEGGEIFQGANVENASYGLTICAERAAVLQAVFAGARRIVAVAVATSTSPPAAPCGMCRQTLAEFAEDCPILLLNDQGEHRRVSLAELLPHGFRPRDLGVGG